MVCSCGQDDQHPITGVHIVRLPVSRTHAPRFVGFRPHVDDGDLRLMDAEIIAWAPTVDAASAASMVLQAEEAEAFEAQGGCS